MRLGTCYYPEHWDRSLWPRDAARMADLGLSLIRIGEFAWSRIEPEPDRFDWAWLDEAIGVLADHGLSVMLGTPTATPPKWLIDAVPDVLAWDREGRPRGFGSRRHYCFSSETYRKQSRRITKAVAARYGANPAVTHWQTDNEFGCHDTTRSYSPMARGAFRRWLADRYEDVAALNEAWGTVFWSQGYGSFDEVELPNLTVTEPNPSHVLDFYRFSSDQVVSFHREQAEIIRAHAPDAVLTHNVMGWSTDFDHRRLGAHTDLLTWDSYPLGFLDQSDANVPRKLAYMRQGDPDFAAFHHDLYRGCAPAFGVVEQQPGPVNWAPSNPAPLPGMVALWGREAAAHGAALYSPFRWRTFPKAQEQYHAGLLRYDDEPAPAHEEVRQLARPAPPPIQGAAPVALVFDYETVWMSEIQPQGVAWRYMDLVRQWYRALRRLGCDVDVTAPTDDHIGYAALFVPSVFHVADAGALLGGPDTRVLLGPRTGSKDAHGNMVPGLPPGSLTDAAGFRVVRSESLPPSYRGEASHGQVSGTWGGWLDHVEVEDVAVAMTGAGGEPLMLARGRVRTLTTILDDDLTTAVIAEVLVEAGQTPQLLPDGLRRRGGTWVNYASEPRAVPDGGTIPPGGTA